MPTGTTTTIYLVRHGITADLQAGRLQGQRRDGGLLPEGRAQIARLAEPLHGKPITACYTSDLKRTHESALVLCQMLTVTVPLKPEPRLREIDFGQWEGLTLAELHARYPHESLEPYQVPRALERYGGESIEALASRLQAFWNTVLEAHEGQSVLIVSHAHALSALLCVALELPIGERWRFGIDPASLTTLLVQQAKNVLVYRLNYSPGE